MTNFKKLLVVAVSVVIVACIPSFAALLATSGRTEASQEIRLVEEGPVHEAFIPPVTAVTAVEAIDQEPPPAATEKVPPQPDPQAEWITGYWTWDSEQEDFLWVSGLWRRPPPGRFWVPGYWEHYDEGWVWVRGFWSEVPADKLVYVEDAPPDPLDDDVPSQPGDDHFWLSGHWSYRPERGDFVWMHGHWERLDPNWVCVPGHWLWRPHSYVFVSACWDWPLELRGHWYGCVHFGPAARVQAVYAPVVAVEPLFVWRRVFLAYPDYTYIIYHHHHFHFGWWHEQFEVPPWWEWDSWWCSPWHHHWQLWWWYTHPGYPHPPWITVSLASRIHPPSEKLIASVKKTRPPSIVTPEGVIDPRKRLDAALKEKPKPGAGKADHRAPILPPATKEKGKVAEKPKEPVATKSPVQPLLPSGQKVAVRPGEPRDKEPPPVKPKTQPSRELPKVVKPPAKEAMPRPAEPKPKKEEKPKGKPDSKAQDTKPATPKMPKAPDPKPKSEPPKEPKEGKAKRGETGPDSKPASPKPSVAPSPRPPEPKEKSKSKDNP